MTHAFHPDVHTHGLADDCDSCAEAAKDPWNLLDEQMLRALFTRTVEGGGARSVPEAAAMYEIRRTLHRFTHLAKLNPEDAYAVLAAVNALPVVTVVPPPAPPEKPAEDVATPPWLAALAREVLALCERPDLDIPDAIFNAAQVLLEPVRP